MIEGPDGRCGAILPPDRWSAHLRVRDETQNGSNHSPEKVDTQILSLS